MDHLTTKKMEKDNTVPGVLSEQQIDVIKEKYSIGEIDKNSVVQYKLCAVITHLEARLDQEEKGDL